MCCWFVKYGLFLTNLIFTLGGLALLGVGIAAQLKLTNVLEVITTEANSIVIAIIVLGAVIFLIAFFGCCGAIRENRFFLTLYGICMTVLAAGKCYVAVVVFKNLSEIRSTVTELLREAFENENIRDQFNVMETTFKCCGTTGPDSYDGALPPSCCPRNEDFCVSENAFEGCNKLITDFFELYGEIIGISILIIMALEVIAVVLTFSFCSTIGRKRSRTV